MQILSANCVATPGTFSKTRICSRGRSWGGRRRETETATETQSLVKGQVNKSLRPLQVATPPAVTACRISLCTYLC